MSEAVVLAVTFIGTLLCALLVAWVFCRLGDRAGVADTRAPDRRRRRIVAHDGTGDVMVFWLRDWQVGPLIVRRGVQHAQWQGWCLLSVQVGGTAVGLLYVRHRDGARGLRGLRLRWRVG